MSQPTITLQAARRIIANGQLRADELGLRAVFAVLDGGANMVAFERMDGAWLASNDLAITKARTSVMFEAPSEALNAPLTLDQPVPHFDHTNGGLLLMGGGAPIFDEDGHLGGAVGVSGGTPEQDADMARVATSAAGLS
ncbi:heme-binding protein [Gordonia sp. ABSL1-1]|uniref:GlcG/HbpS family heme-binding protein n=1 Tax=Gordonia sp. ABSL1-1 TaxID=3053923 RepID=UPI0025728132|nr:heme-binding protein [Gordonia sp. ABSL1-1]MDL9938882.1 heme-binding protein [Gordonia sp. ABSL1-1]